MQSLPYELLQHIASSLLPRNQCRFALTSRHNYRYLYSDLLKWYAKWALIAPPKYKYHATGVSEGLSLIQYNNKVILYDYNWCVCANNLTTMLMEIPGSQFNVKISTFLFYSRIIHEHKSNIMRGCYRYMNKDIIILSMQMTNPFIKICVYDNSLLLYDNFQLSLYLRMHYTAQY